MARPRRRADEEATTSRLLAAATSEFARRGFEGARLADISEGVGITRPSLLYHFATKEELYAAVIHHAFEALGGALADALLGEGAFVDRFDEAVRRLIAFFEERPDTATLIIRELLAQGGPGHAMLLEAGVPILNRLERIIRADGRGTVRRDVPVRAGLLQIFSGVLLQSASGPLRVPIWGRTDKTRALARALFFERTE